MNVKLNLCMLALHLMVDDSEPEWSITSDVTPDGRDVLSCVDMRRLSAVVTFYDDGPGMVTVTIDEAIEDDSGTVFWLQGFNPINEEHLAQLVANYIMAGEGDASEENGFGPGGVRWIIAPDSGAETLH